MILMTHPRSGSEWLLTSLSNVSYAGWELFGYQNYIDDHRYAPFRNLSFDAKLNLLKRLKFDSAHKIHFSDLSRLKQNNFEVDKLISILNSRTDLYLLRRKNIKASILSCLIALKNSLNFHNCDHLLTQKFKAEKTLVDQLIAAIYYDTEKYFNMFKYQEELYYEDLIDNKNISKTLKIDFSKSLIKKRNSVLYYDLIENFDEVNSWIDQKVLQ